MAKTDLTAQELRKILGYNPETGEFVWLISPRKNVKAGAMAGCRENGYTRIVYKRVGYKAHRLAWLYVTGQWPTDDIDHRDTDRNNNAFQNLREATRSINTQNLRKARKDNLSCGLLGAGWHKATGKWKAKIQVDGRQIWLGLHATAEDAHAAYIAAKRIHHPGNTL